VTLPVPPKLLRRLVLAPLLALAELALIVVSPVLMLVAVVLSPVFGGWRPVRLVAIAIDGIARHLAAMLACLGLWVASGFGWKLRSEPMRRAHYAVLRWFVAGLYRTIVRVARVEVRVHDSEEAERALRTPGRPVIVFSRHAGEGDTLLVIHQMLSLYDRGPRVVMHEALRLDPLIDVMGERLPNRFLDPRGGDTEREVEAMARDLGETAALVIFPEGKNFSEETRRRGIERLERLGHEDEAAVARGMRHVSAPRPGGSLAALHGAPHADVVVMAHSGFPTGLGELWRCLPAKQVVDVRMWLEPAAGVPEDRDERIDWLFDRWRRLDEWVEERRQAAELTRSARPTPPRGRTQPPRDA
jgi:1-acyl-sn-glycerol-3-phosphate acyltransferase